MNQRIKMKPILAVVSQIFVIILLAACTTVEPSDPLTACRPTDDPANPYEVITITNYIFPVPASGCPTGPVSINDGKIAICHATGSETNPYNKITVSVNGLNGHGAHEGDVFPAADGSCPTNTVVLGDDATVATVCHVTDDPANPYEAITVNNTELDQHCEQYPNDINPALANGCPIGPAVISDGKITICHATSSETNPYNKITVSVNGLNGHGAHEGDVFPAADDSCPTNTVVLGDDATVSIVCHATGDPANPYEALTVNNTELDEHRAQYPNDINPAPATGCPTGPAVISDGKITICHATGSQTNPYNEITVSVNGLNGHGKHEGDIIPAPAGGCPAGSKDNNSKKP